MIIGVPKEIKENENRIAIIPSGVEDLVKNGHKVLIQKSAGIGSGFDDTSFINSGAIIVDSMHEVFENAELIVKVKEPQIKEIDLISKGQMMFTFFHFAASEDLTNQFIESGGIAIAYETVQNKNNELPLLIPMSEVAGRMAVQNGAKCLEANMGGTGKLLSGVPGVEPATVLIIGAGIVGMNAAKISAGLGAKVYIMDINSQRLKFIDNVMPSNVFTLYSNNHNIIDLLPKTDLLIGAILVVGDKAPKIITKEMLNLMNKGSVIVDVAVDQGGCVETCKPTTHSNPTFEVNGIIHYCVSNMPGAVPFTSTLALANTTLPYIKKIANKGLKNAIQSDSSLAYGLNIYKSQITHQGVSNAFNLKYCNPLDVI